MRNLSEREKTGSSLQISILPHFFSLLFLHPLRHRFGAAYQAEIVSAANGAEMADIERMEKIVPFVTCEITSGQYVCELMFGVDVRDLNLGV